MNKKEGLENFCKGKGKNGNRALRELLDINRAELKGINSTKDKAIKRFEREYIKLIRELGSNCPVAYLIVQKFGERYHNYLEKL